MSTIDHMNDLDVAEFDSEPAVSLELSLHEAEALRTQLLKPAADGTTSLDDPVLSALLANLGRAVDAVHAIANVRRELEQAGLAVAHLSDDQVRELGRRISEVATPVARS